MAAKRKTRKAKAKRAPAKSAKLIDGLRETAIVASVFSVGKTTRVLLDCPATLATEILGGALEDSADAGPVTAVEHDLKSIRARAPEIAASGLAASALQLARELMNPYNSATSKSMCARELRETMARLWEMAPEEERGDSVDELVERRRARRAAASG